MAVEVIDKNIIFLPSSADPIIQDVENGSSSSFLLLTVDQHSEEDGTPIVDHNQIEKDNNTFIIPDSPEIDEQVEENAIAVSSSIDMGKMERVKVRRNSMGNKKDKAIPSYLRASTGSCHDYCKYGKLHTFEKQEKRNPISGNKTVNKEPSLSIEIGGKMVNTRTTKKKTEIRVEMIKSKGNKLSSGKQKVVSYLKKSGPGECSSVSSKLKVSATRSSLPSNDSSEEINSGKYSSSNISGNLTISKNHRTTNAMSKNITRRPVSKKSFSLCPLPAACDGSKNEVLEENYPVVSSGLISSSGRSSAKNFDMIASSQGSGSQRNGKAERKSYLKDPTNIPVSSMGSKRGDILPRNTGLLADVTGSTNSLLATTDACPSSRRSGNVKPEKRLPKDSLSLGTLQKGVPKHGAEVEKVSVKIIHMVEPKPNKSIKSSPTSSLSVKSFRASRSHNEGKHVNADSAAAEGNRLKLRKVVRLKSPNGTVKGESKGAHRGNKPMHTDDGKLVTKKLTFRRGKVVSLESDDGGPRKLRFRKGTVLGDNHVKIDIGRRSFRRRKELAGDAFGKSSLGEMVVLRHQDVHSKKEELVSFNNVIEETANKLVETRKSKVKALVGAFETVISLQESKASITTGN